MSGILTAVFGEFLDHLIRGLFGWIQTEELKAQNETRIRQEEELKRVKVSVNVKEAMDAIVRNRTTAVERLRARTF